MCIYNGKYTINEALTKYSHKTCPAQDVACTKIATQNVSCHKRFPHKTFLTQNVYTQNISVTKCFRTKLFFHKMFLHKNFRKQNVSARNLSNTKHSRTKLFLSKMFLHKTFPPLVHHFFFTKFGPEFHIYVEILSP